jgi:hypothetical protein
MGWEATATEQGSQHVLNLQVFFFFFLTLWRMVCVFVSVCCRCEMQGLTESWVWKLQVPYSMNFILPGFLELASSLGYENYQRNEQAQTFQSWGLGNRQLSGSAVLSMVYSLYQLHVGHLSP